MTKHAFHSAAKRSIATFVALAMVLALLPTLTINASAAGTVELSSIATNGGAGNAYTLTESYTIAPENTLTMTPGQTLLIDHVLTVQGTLTLDSLANIDPASRGSIVVKGANAVLVVHSENFIKSSDGYIQLTATSKVTMSLSPDDGIAYTLERISGDSSTPDATVTKAALAAIMLPGNSTSDKLVLQGPIKATVGDDDEIDLTTGTMTLNQDGSVALVGATGTITFEGDDFEEVGLTGFTGGFDLIEGKIENIEIASGTISTEIEAPDSFVFGINEALDLDVDTATITLAKGSGADKYTATLSNLTGAIELAANEDLRTDPTELITFASAATLVLSLDQIASIVPGKNKDHFRITDIAITAGTVTLESALLAADVVLAGLATALADLSLTISGTSTLFKIGNDAVVVGTGGYFIPGADGSVKFELTNMPTSTALRYTTNGAVSIGTSTVLDAIDKANKLVIASGTLTVPHEKALNIRGAVEINGTSIMDVAGTVNVGNGSNATASIAIDSGAKLLFGGEPGEGTGRVTVHGKINGTGKIDLNGNTRATVLTIESGGKVTAGVTGAAGGALDTIGISINALGVITVSADVDEETYHYAVVTSEKYGEIDEDIADWTTNTALDAVGTAIGTGDGVVVALTTTKPTLNLASYEGKYLVVVRVKDNKLTAAGTTQITGVAIPVTGATISGEGKAGVALTATPNAGANRTPFTYAWYRSETPITASVESGAISTAISAKTVLGTGATYIPDATDRGKHIFVVITDTATPDGEGAKSAMSASVQIAGATFTLDSVSSDKYTMLLALTGESHDYDIYYTDATNVTLSFAGEASGDIANGENNKATYNSSNGRVTVTGFADRETFNLTRSETEIKVRFYQVAKVTMSVIGADKDKGTVAYAFTPPANPANNKTGTLTAPGYTHTELLDQGDNVVLTVSNITAGYRVKAVKSSVNGAAASTVNAEPTNTYTVSTLNKGSTYDITVEFEPAPPSVSPNAAASKEGTLALTGTTADNPGIYTFGNDTSQVKYEMYVPGDLTKLSFPLSTTTGVKYMRSTDGTTWAGNTEYVYNGSIPTLADGDIVIFYTSASNWFKVRVIEAALVTVNVVGGGAAKHVKADFTSTKNNANDTTDGAAEIGNGTNLASIRRWRDVAADNETVALTVTGDDYSVTQNGKIYTATGDNVTVASNLFTFKLTGAGQYRLEVTFVDKTLEATDTVGSGETLEGLIQVPSGGATLAIDSAASVGNANILVGTGDTLTISTDKETLDLGQKLTVSGGGTVTVDKPVTVAAAGGLEVNGGTMKIGGETASETNGTLTVAENAELKVDGGGSVLEVKNSVLTVASNANLNVSGGGTLKIDTGSEMIVASGAKLDVTTGGKLTIDNAGAELTVGEGAAISVGAGSTLTVDNTAAMTVKGDDAKLDIGAGATLMLDGGAALTIGDEQDTGTGAGAALNVTSGTLNVTSGSLTVAKSGALTLDAASTLDVASGKEVNVAGGSITLGGATVTGAGTLVIGAPAPAGPVRLSRSIAIPEDVTSTLNITEDQSLGLTITLHANGAIVVADGKTLTISKAIADNGGKIILGAGAVLDASSGAVAAVVVDYNGKTLTLNNGKYVARMMTDIVFGGDGADVGGLKKLPITINGLAGGDFVYFQVTEGSGVSAKLMHMADVIEPGITSISRNIYYSTSATVTIMVFAAEPDDLTTAELEGTYGMGTKP